ncbi:MAG: YkgJ family cysteine cluster protein [Formosimonas sp.]
MSEPCMSCGACCAFFRVSFYWSETDAHPDGSVPAALTVPITPHFVAMRGTQSKPPRCVELDGHIGQAVSCRIYDKRSSTCRDFSAGDERCNEARRHHGLPALHLNP